MNNKTNIHGRESLQAEIGRLQVKAQEIEEKLDDNFEHLQEKFSSMATNSFFHRARRNDEGTSSSGSFFKNGKLEGIVNEFAGHITDRAAEALEKIIDRIFQKHKAHSSG
jgi:hypothetical protein